MSRKAQRIQKPSPRGNSTSSVGGNLRRQCACGGGCAECNAVRGSGSLQPATSKGQVGHDFSNVAVFIGGTSGPVVQDQTPAQSGGLGDEFTQNVPPESTMEPTTELQTGSNTPKGTPVIDSVELIDSSSGAVGGFGPISCQASLNQPGPYNDHWATGEVANVHQIHFHLSQGWAGDLRANRQVNRTAATAGKQTTKTGWDGPPDHEVVVTNDKLVIADAPGFCTRGTESDFPATYSADFGLYAFDPLNLNILASIAYHVEISKTYFGQIDPVNTITVTDKKIGRAVKSPVPPKK